MANHDEEPAPLDYAPACAKPTWVYFGSWWNALLLILGPLAALIAAVVIPSTMRAREGARVVRCGANLAQMGVAFERYAEAHKGSYPPTLDLLVVQGHIGVELLSCPTADSDSEQSAYVYIAGQTRRHHDGNVLVYESPANHAGRVANVLLVGGAVKHLDPAQLETAIAATLADLAQPATSRAP